MEEPNEYWSRDDLLHMGYCTITNCFCASAVGSEFCSGHDFYRQYFS